ncbi:MAG: hypothetical protein HRT88_19385, partial [Lentisphaeraceae bacterium]|nr:hypothetical protein [Lentisphaeraceae bacterium]
VLKLRSDYNQLRTALKKSYENQRASDKTGLFAEIIRLANMIEVVRFAYKPRRKIQMARSLAQIGARDMIATENFEQLVYAVKPKTLKQASLLKCF